jgi:hypothetical protein
MVKLDFLIAKMFVNLVVSLKKPKATIMSLPLKVDIMITKWLRPKDALNMAKALKLPEQVAVLYFAFDRSDLKDIFLKNFYDLQLSSYKFLLKNKMFQVEATSNAKTWAAVKTKDLDFVKKYLEQVQPDLNFAFFSAIECGFIDAAKLLLSCAGVDPSAQNNAALFYASQYGNLEIVKLLLSDSRVDPSAHNNDALRRASMYGHLDIVKLLLSHSRFRFRT